MRGMHVSQMASKATKFAGAAFLAIGLLGSPNFAKAQERGYKLLHEQNSMAIWSASGNFLYRDTLMISPPDWKGRLPKSTEIAATSDRENTIPGSRVNAPDDAYFIAIPGSRCLVLLHGWSSRNHSGYENVYSSKFLDDSLTILERPQLVASNEQDPERRAIGIAFADRGLVALTPNTAKLIALPKGIIDSRESTHPRMHLLHKGVYIVLDAGKDSVLNIFFSCEMGWNANRIGEVKYAFTPAPTVSEEYLAPAYPGANNQLFFIEPKFEGKLKNVDTLYWFDQFSDMKGDIWQIQYLVGQLESQWVRVEEGWPFGMTYDEYVSYPKQQKEELDKKWGAIVRKYRLAFQENDCLGPQGVEERMPIEVQEKLLGKWWRTQRHNFRFDAIGGSSDEWNGTRDYNLKVLRGVEWLQKNGIGEDAFREKYAQQ